MSDEYRQKRYGTPGPEGANYWVCPNTGRILKAFNNDDKVLCDCKAANPKNPYPGHEYGAGHEGPATHEKKYLSPARHDDWELQGEENDMKRKRNRRMEEKLSGTHKEKAIDLQFNAKTPDGEYILEAFVDGVDYCDASTESWIWSIGRHKKTGQILAALDGRFYQNEEYECLWLR